jgi:SAM-dependent methyltransferase
MSQEPAISYNRRAHDRGLPSYQRRHPEIYNRVEQARVADSVGEALRLAGKAQPRALDFGTGAGNLADHLAAAGAELSIADVSPRSVASVGDRLQIPATRRHTLDGRTVTGIPERSFDLVGVYSVLHHIPDYLATVRELVRLLGPGGVLYLDHEAAPAYWEPDSALLEYRGRLDAIHRRRSGPRALRLLSGRWWRIKLRTWRNPRFQIDGDLHVWPDDHIEWDRLENILVDSGAAPVLIRDYLLCRGEGELAELHREYRDRCADMRLGIFRKV